MIIEVTCRSQNTLPGSLYRSGDVFFLYDAELGLSSVPLITHIKLLKKRYVQSVVGTSISGLLRVVKALLGPKLFYRTS